jgi:hypothetical protein
MDFLSKTNRRLYRQARVPQVKIDVDQDANATIEVFALANNWMVHRALKMGYEMYLENSADERSRIKGTNIARWEDFRVELGESVSSTDPVQYRVQGLATATPVPLTSGEFNDTIVVDAAGVSRSFWWNPTSGGSRYSLLEEYDKAGNAQPSPQTSTGDMPYDDLMADDDAAMGAALQTRGNSPPYAPTGVGADKVYVKVATIGTGTSQKLSTGFFDAPCGFVILRPTSGDITSPGTDIIQWTVKAGDYKGVHAPSMLE